MNDNQVVNIFNYIYIDYNYNIINAKWDTKASSLEF